MKKFFYFSSLAALGLSFLSCSSEEINDLTNNKVNNPTSAYALPLDKVLKKADLFLQELEQNGGTRAKERTVSSVERLGVQTRSNGEDSGCYIVNYGENDGFAIVSTDSRTMPIYAISPEGHFSINDTVGNPVLKGYIDVITNGIIIDPGTPDPIVDVDNAPNITQLVKPLISESVRKWTQKSHNQYVRYKCGNSADTPVGCVVLSAAQIMSVLKWPNVINVKDADNHYTGDTLYLDWDAINSGDPSADDQIAHLMEILGRPYYYDVTYTLTGSSADATQTSEVFEKLGYDNYSDIEYVTYYSQDDDIEADVIYELRKRRRPVQALATGYSTLEQTSIVDRHAFVIDGYCVQQVINVVQASYNTYYHIVWGRGREINGYYYLNPLNKIFNKSARFKSGNDLAGDIPAYYKFNRMVKGF